MGVQYGLVPLPVIRRHRPRYSHRLPTTGWPQEWQECSVHGWQFEG